MSIKMNIHGDEDFLKKPQKNADVNMNKNSVCVLDILHKTQIIADFCDGLFVKNSYLY